MVTRFFLAFLFIYAAALGTSVYAEQIRPAEHVHYHAGFQVYINGQLQDYSSFMYMNIKPCSGPTEHARMTPEEEQLEKAHLHDGIGDVVHVHLSNATWQDLFTNIKVAFPKNVPVEGYRNGERVENLLNQTIQSYESVIFFVGDTPNKQELLKNQVTKSRILEAESRSETCGG
jgi:hypothetical protein